MLLHCTYYMYHPQGYADGYGSKTDPEVSLSLWLPLQQSKSFQTGRMLKRDNVHENVKSPNGITPAHPVSCPTFDMDMYTFIYMTVHVMSLSILWTYSFAVIHVDGHACGNYVLDGHVVLCTVHVF